MKTLTLVSLLLSLCLSSVALAEEPAELVKLRAIYDNSLRSDFQKVGKLYHGRLVELKENYMEAKNLEGAVAVDAEIKKLRETHGKMVVKVSEPQRKASPLDGVWHQYIGSKKWIKTIKGDRMLDETGISKYTVKNGVVKIHREDGYWWELKIHPDNPDVMEGAAKGGTKTKWVRFKW
jgi:hypothetical protein